MKQQDIYFPRFLNGNVGDWTRRCRQNARKLYPRNAGQNNGPANWETLRREMLFNDLRFTNDKSGDGNLKSTLHSLPQGLYCIVKAAKN